MWNKIKSFFSSLGRVFAPVGRFLVPVGRFLKRILAPIGRFAKKHRIITAIIAIILIVALVMTLLSPKRGDKGEKNISEATIGRTTITQSISGSSVVEANDEYSVTALVSGEILKADFEEGDTIEKDQVLYEVDSSDAENSVRSSDLSVEKAQTAYNKALKAHTDEISDISDTSTQLSLQKAQNSYNEAVDSINDLTVSAGFSGTVSDVYVSAGDDVVNGTKIAEVVDDTTLKARVPFNASDATNIFSGEAASVTLVSTGTVLSGVVTSVSSGSETLNGNIRVSYVTIEVSNPGGVKEGDYVTAMVGDYACNDVGSFEAAEKRSVTSKVNGTISGVWVVKGDYILSGSTIATIDSENVDNQVRDAEIALREAQLKKESAELESMDSDDYAAKLKSARLSLDEALLQRDKLNEQLEDYTITSPISGTVVAKNKKVGDKLESGGGASSSSSTDSNVLAVIYDMSSLCFQLDVDELDVKKVEVGQEVIVTADAVEGKSYTGVVENVSINGTIGTNGVTTYPVKVRIQDFDDQLLPGMNIEAVITVSEATDVIAVPVNAVNRGNTVYVKGEKESEDDRAPEGYKTVRIETGISNDMYVEVTSGLNEGDVVYVTPTAGEEQQQMMPGMGRMPGGMQGGGMPGGSGMPGGGGMPGGMQGGGNRGGGGMPGGGGGMR